MHRIFLCLLLALAGCGMSTNTISTQPVEEQLAYACQQAASVYQEAALLNASGKLSASALAAFKGAAPMVSAACDPSNPPADLTTALNNVTNAVNQLVLAKGAQ